MVNSTITDMHLLPQLGETSRNNNPFDPIQQPDNISILYPGNNGYEREWHKNENDRKCHQEIQ